MTFLLKDKWTECLHSQETCHHTQLHNTTLRGTTVGCTVRMAAMFVAKDGKLRIMKVQWNSLAASCPRWISRSMNHKCSLQTRICVWNTGPICRVDINNVQRSHNNPTILHSHFGARLVFLTPTKTLISSKGCHLVVLYCTVLYCTVLCRSVLYCTVLYCTVLYCTVLYCTVLYCTVLYAGCSYVSSASACTSQWTQCLSYKNWFRSKSACLTENTKHNKITAIAKRFRKWEPHKQHNSITMTQSRTHFQLGLNVRCRKNTIQQTIVTATHVPRARLL
jgi:hypothetical protein